MASGAIQCHSEKTEVVNVLLIVLQVRFLLRENRLLYRETNYIVLCLDGSHSKLNLLLGLRGLYYLSKN